MSETPTHLLLFDVDMTLLSTHRAGVYAMADAAREVFGEQFNFDGISFAGSLDSHIYADATRRHGIAEAHRHHAAFLNAYAEHLAHELAQRAAHVRAMPGMISLLADLRRGRPVCLGVLTGNYRRTGRMKLKAAGIDPDWFEIDIFAEDAPDRPALVAEAIRRFEARYRTMDHQKVIVIGDTPKDIHCAKANGCLAFCVATGSFSIDQLLEAGADVAVENLADHRPLLELLN